MSLSYIEKLDDVTNSEAIATLRESVIPRDLDSSLDGLLGYELSTASVWLFPHLLANLLFIDPIGRAFDLLGIL